MKKIILISVIFGLLTVSSVARAKSEAEKAAAQDLPAVTVFIDISSFSRKNGAADKLTDSHREFAQFGYALIAVNVYTENSDLEGFFVSYQKK